MSEIKDSLGPVYAIYQDDSLYLFANIESVEFKGISCVKGLALAAGKEDWRDGLLFYLPVDSISRIIEYKNINDYRKVLADHYAKKAQT